MRLQAYLVAVALTVAGPVAAQHAEVVKNVNLRRDPSTDRRPIRLLTPGTVLHLSEADTVEGFVLVTTPDTVAGWVWTRNIRVFADTSSSESVTTVTALIAGHKKCPVFGDGEGEKQQHTDRMKNRTKQPKPPDFDDAVNLAAMLKPGEDEDRFDESQAGEWSSPGSVDGSRLGFQAAVE